MKNKKIIFGSLLLLAFASAPSSQLTILSGSDQATQYSLAQDIVSIVTDTLKFKIVNKETNGAADNFNQLADPKSQYKLAIIPADFLYYMQAQDMKFNTQKTKNLKVLVPLGYAQIHLVAKASKGFKGLKDLQGNKVAIGSAEQGTYRTALLIQERSDVNFVPMNTNFENSLRDLSTSQISAFFIVSSAPITKLDVNPQSMADQLALVPLEDFNDWAKYYKKDTIFKSEYKWLDHDVPTYSVPTVLVVNESKLSSNERTQVLELKSGIQNRIDKLKATGHPQWKEINLTGWNESDWPLFK